MLGDSYFRYCFIKHFSTVSFKLRLLLEDNILATIFVFRLQLFVFVGLRGIQGQNLLLVSATKNPENISNVDLDNQQSREQNWEENIDITQADSAFRLDPLRETMGCDPNRRIIAIVCLDHERNCKGEWNNLGENKQNTRGFA